MVLFISPFKAQQKVADSIRETRLLMELTQEGLSERSGVHLAKVRAKRDYFLRVLFKAFVDCRWARRSNAGTKAFEIEFHLYR